MPLTVRFREGVRSAYAADPNMEAKLPVALLGNPELAAEFEALLRSWAWTARFNER